MIHLLEQYGTVMIFDGRLATYLNWIPSIPREEIFEHVHLCVDCSWAFALAGQLDHAERFALAGKKAIPSARPIHIAIRDQVIPPDEVLGDLTSVQAYCARLRGDSKGVRRYSQEALQQLPADAYTVRGVIALNLGMDYYQNWEWEQAVQAFTESVEMILKAHENIYVAIAALCMLGSIRTQRADLDAAADYFQRAITLGQENALSESGAIPASCLGHRGLAEIHYLRNEVEPARKSLETALELARRSGNTDMLYNIYQLGAWLALLCSDTAGAERAIQKTEEYFPKVLDSRTNPDLVTLWAAFQLLQGKPQSAIDALETGGFSMASIPFSLSDAKEKWQSIPAYLMLARALLLADRSINAMQLLDVLLPAIVASQDIRLLIEARLLTAVLLDKQNNIYARESLLEVFRLAEPSGYVSPFLNIGKPAYELIRRETLAGALKSNYAQKILATFAGQTRRVRAASLTESDFLSGTERLTPQETQILHLLAQGLSSTEVAEELMIAVSTARSYIKNIHRKLNAHSREEVLARGKQLGLV